MISGLLNYTTVEGDRSSYSTSLITTIALGGRVCGRFVDVGCIIFDGTHSEESRIFRERLNEPDSI